jgi:hypothetical protein
MSLCAHSEVACFCGGYDGASSSTTKGISHVVKYPIGILQREVALYIFSVLYDFCTKLNPPLQAWLIIEVYVIPLAVVFLI